MMDDTDIRTVLITGSTAGIGEATAVAFAKDGCRVVVNGRDEGRVSAAVDRVMDRSQSATVFGVAADVSQPEGAAKLLDEVPEVDILVNNAGIFGARPVFDIPDEEWLHYFDFNVLSGIRLARQYVGGMRSRGWGRIIFVSSDSSVFVPTEMVHYAASKTAQLSVSRGMAQELAGTGVTVNAVLPGPTHTQGVEEFIQANFGGDAVSFAEAEKRFVDRELPTSLLGRLIRPDEVASLIRYVGSAASSATSGAALRVDGGVLPSIIP